MFYDPFDWYWVSSDGRLYSSCQKAIVKTDNKNFSDWQKAGKAPTPWPRDGDGKETDAALAEVLAPYGLSIFPLSLEKQKDHIKTLIDNDAETERLKYITNGVGQSMTYQEKVNQAQVYSGAIAAHLADKKSNPAPNDKEYPLLAASLGIDGDTLAEVAETVTYAYVLWQYIGGAIEKARLQAKAAIGDAKTIEAAQAIYNAIKWPKPDMAT